MTAAELYIHIFRNTFQLGEDCNLDSLRYNSISTWDSIGHLMLISEIEQTFNIVFEMDDIIDFSSFEIGKQLLKKYNVEL